MTSKKLLREPAEEFFNRIGRLPTKPGVDPSLPFRRDQSGRRVVGEGHGKARSALHNLGQVLAKS